MIEYYNGEEIVEFISKCPVEGCTNVQEINWKHEICSNQFYINDKGYIICFQCKYKKKFFDHEFNCGVHENLKPPSKDPQRIIMVFSKMAGELNNSGGKKFVHKLLNSLIEQCDYK